MSNSDKKNPRERMIERIQATKIIKRVNDCALGKDEMTAIELQAAKICMAKVVPDLKQTDMKVDLETRITQVEHTIVKTERTDSSSI